MRSHGATAARLALALALALPAGAGSGSFFQDRFVTSMWVDPQVPIEEMDERYGEVAEANFSVVLSFGIAPGQSHDRVSTMAKLDACEKHGLKALVSPCESSVPPFAGKPGGSCVNVSHPALWGWELSEEPRVSGFPALAVQIANLTARRPDTLRFVNLLPNYAAPALLGNKSHPVEYGEYVSSYIRATNPQLLCMDHYPHFRTWSGEKQWPNCSKAGYRSNLAVFRATGLPFWNLFNTLPYGGHSDPTESELRWQAFTSLACESVCHAPQARLSVVVAGLKLTRELGVSSFRRCAGSGMVHILDPWWWRAVGSLQSRQWHHHS
jgi:hypothetical protein